MLEDTKYLSVRTRGGEDLHFSLTPIICNSNTDRCISVCRGHRKNMNPKNKELCNQMMNIADGSGLENNDNEYTNSRNKHPYRFGWGMGVDLNR